MIVRDPMPFVAALWARMAESGVNNVFATVALLAAALFEELVDRADEMSQDKDNENSKNFSTKLEQLKSHYSIVIKFVEMINTFFGPILLFQVIFGFAVPIFEFDKIWSTKWQVLRYYFECGHSVIRFLLTFLIPSYAVTKQVVDSKIA